MSAIGGMANRHRSLVARRKSGILTAGTVQTRIISRQKLNRIDNTGIDFIMFLIRWPPSGIRAAWSEAR
jgi:hypothetical protein